MSLSRDELLAAVGKITPQSLPREEVKVWGGTVWVRGMTGPERGAFEMESQQLNKSEGEVQATASLRERIAVRTVCDENGHLILTLQDAKALAQADAASLEVLTAVACRLSGLTRGDVAELEKNSRGTTGGAGS